MIEDNTVQDLLTAELETLSANRAILRLAGEIDMDTVHVLADQLEMAPNGGWSSFVIDLSNVSFMDSVGLHALKEGKRLIHEHDIEIVLVTSPQVRRLFELVFPKPIFAARVDSVDEALRFLGLDAKPDDE